MLKYARIINEETKEVQVGAGCSDDFYIEIGMELLDIEQAYTGDWYLVGYTPIKPEPTEEEIKNEQIAELKQKLADTDYKAIKYAEGEYTEEDYTPVKEMRKEWRRAINELEEQ